jgi:hypothetical protein
MHPYLALAALFVCAIQMAHYHGLEDTASDTVHREQRSASEKGEYRAGLGRLCDRSAPYYYWEDHTLEIGE